MKSFLLETGVIPCAFALCSCASIVSKSHRPVTITSSAQGAKVTLSKGNGVAIQTGETPMTVNLDTSSGFFKKAVYRIEASKPGYEPTSSTFTADLNGWYFGNIIFGAGGLIGALIVDPATGAMWKLEDTYSVNLAPAKSVMPRMGRSVETSPAVLQVRQSEETSDREAPPKRFK